MYDFISEKDGDIIISCYIQPGASKTRFCGIFNESLKLQVACPPVDGKANNEVIKFLSKAFKISKSGVNIIKGEKQRLKSIKISNFTKDDFIKIYKELEARS
ncbi:MAG: DUF167 domain-containing protein [Bdellovibrionota bacterium]